VKGYEAARAGKPLDLPARPAGYACIAFHALAPWHALPRSLPTFPEAGQAALPDALDPDALSALFELDVRAGTYIRAFARDLGVALGVPAHLAGLRRVRSGRVRIADAQPLERLASATPCDPLQLLNLPRVELDARSAARLRDGQKLSLEIPGRSVLVDPQGSLVAIAEMEAGRVRPLRVWREGC
jgi:tRNA pseudouridine55 synthase